MVHLSDGNGWPTHPPVLQPLTPAGQSLGVDEVGLRENEDDLTPRPQGAEICAERRWAVDWWTSRIDEEEEDGGSLDDAPPRE